MSERWSIGNWVQPLSHEQFQTLTAQFKAAVEKSFGTDCNLQINAMTEPKSSITTIDDDLQSWLDQKNEANTFFKTSSLSSITPAVWEKARYVEVIVRPADENKAPSSAFGHAEFKGNLPTQATFYLQPEHSDVQQSMIRQNRLKRSGDGYRSNGMVSFS